MQQHRGLAAAVVLSAIVLITVIVSGPGAGSAASPPASLAQGSGVRAFLTPTMTAYPTTGPVETTITFNGSGYAASSSMTVSWSSGTACVTNTSVSGTFSCTFSIPATPAGSHTFTGTDGSSNSATAAFIVTAKLQVSPTAGPAGSSVSFSGTGYAASSTLTVTWQGGSITACSSGTSSAGSATCAYTIPVGTAASAYLFTGSDGSHSASVSYSVNYTPVLALNKTSGAVGISVNVLGSHYPSGIAVTVTWDTSATVCTPAANASGEFACSFVIPASPVGAQSFAGKDANGANAKATFTVVPQLAASPSTGPAGMTVTFVGTGFSNYGDCGENCGTSMAVTWKGGTSACTGGVTGSGGATCTFAIPSGTTVGAYPFTAVDYNGNLASTTVNVNYTPVLSLNRTSGPVGTTIKIDGSFYPAGIAVTVTWDTSATVCTPTANASGEFACSFMVPASPVGAQTLAGKDTNAGIGRATFTVVPQLTASPSTGPAGMTVTFVGTGFSNYGDCGENCGTSMAVTWKGGTSACTGGVTGSGGATCTFAIPSGTTVGDYPFTAIDYNGNLASTSVDVNYTPALVVAPLSGTVGTTVTITGSHYPAGISVLVTWGTTATICTPTANASGGFVCSFIIPASPVGPQSLSGKDTNVGIGKATFTVLPQLNPSPTSVPAGASVTFVGTGFSNYGDCGENCGTSMAVTWKGGTSACTAGVGGSGGASCAFTIPASTPKGPYVFTAEDYNGNLASATVTVGPVLSVAPGEGNVGTHALFTAAGFAPNSAFSLTWSQGTACSGMTTVNGTFTCTYVIPLSTPKAVYTFTGTDAASHNATATFQVVVSQYLVTVRETGLATGTEWWLNTASTSFTSNSTNLSFYEGNGSYAYALASANSSRVAPGGHIVVSGASVNITVVFSQFSPQLYGPDAPVSFVETGLPIGGGWGVTVGGSTTHGDSTKIAVYLYDGSYNYTLVPPGGYVGPAGGTVSVTAAPHGVTVHVRFSPWEHLTVDFTATGLTAGHAWSVALSPVTRGLRVTPHSTSGTSTSTLSWNDLANGSYRYSAHAAGYSAVTGTFVLNGSTVPISVSFHDALPILRSPSTDGRSAVAQALSRAGKGLESVVAPAGLLLASFGLWDRLRSTRAARPGAAAPVRSAP